ncbi:DUF5000 domain-containing lipoprotein [Niabella beijingensis]|uniref:DUF5000 domain-containing lipoprotein n=1 Tax=Niabella beijingensis TaxID=2872700 RepID=UPI001CBB090C|nr:DUF5000 domain-containing lipoprotein [Niabella beijingensis]MBZ4190922.1 DUF4959 domain-containing protein [Niabella beijingensis]
MQQRIHLLFLIVAFTILGCERDALKDPLDAGDGAPARVTNVKVENVPGGAVISYDVPDDSRLLYVKAVYDIREGVTQEIKSSYYNKTLKVEGFPDTKEYAVKLYSVSRGEQVSEPVETVIHPLEPPIKNTFRSLKMEETFGGVRLTFDNPVSANLVMTVIAEDSVGQMKEALTYYTKSIGGSFAVRGFDPVKRRFGVYIRDRWNNRSDTLFGEYTPWLEKLLDRTKIKALNLITDQNAQHCCGVGLSDLWDGVFNGGNVFHTKPGTGLPQWFSFDLGVKAKISRFKFYHRRSTGQGASDGAYNGGDPKVFELWGSDQPVNDGTWDSWFKIGDFTSLKPSGLPLGTVTEEDFNYAVVNGEEFDFPPDAPPVRYLRWKTNRVWGALDHIYMAELTFWGDY